jgi:hypothetical protein
MDQNTALVPGEGVAITEPLFEAFFVNETEVDLFESYSILLRFRGEKTL